MSTTVENTVPSTPSSAPEGSTGSTGPEPTAPAERIAELRAEIDACDAAIIAAVQRRLEVSREIGQLRRAAGGTRLSLAREQAVLATFSAALGPADGTTLGMMLLRRGRGAL
ncbi:chorismate mutase [Modestobacter sp. Leaf380]|uniref:chorismate mutase n=1 Tax=Modestobacter sp. Leaf380 TaxID=1736356 RepID=UPI0006F3E605|nr:chorismate mutase [Modestobacter sp. Leaf380]KQS73485.1 chorismate mutase [Modestobacter sp. Leaf380]